MKTASASTDPPRRRGTSAITLVLLVTAFLLGLVASSAVRTFAEERSDRRIEREYLSVIDVELGVGLGALDSAIAETEARIFGAEDLRAWMDGEHQISSARMMTHLRNLSEWPEFAIPSRGYDDLVRTGRFGRVEDAFLRRRLTDVYRRARRLRETERPRHDAMLERLDELNRGAWLYVFEPEIKHPVQFIPTLNALADSGFANFARGELRELSAYLPELRALRADIAELRQDILNRRRVLGLE